MRPLLALALLLSLSAALPASAQSAPGGPPRPRAGEMRQHQADDLALVLGLTPAQRPALDAFLAASAPPEPPRNGDRPMPRPQADRTPPSFDQKLTRMEEMSARRAADDGKRIAALRTFYAALDPRQKLVFEALDRMHQGPGGHEGPHGGPHGPGGPDGDGPPPPSRD